mmetsp:Transcript_14580/g.42748  ORF Transcript_14580/g.42748 Transcript_14580/m.42748 type:complete len:229 (+) Transcript_14580:807-1493(+)
MGGNTSPRIVPSPRAEWSPHLGVASLPDTVRWILRGIEGDPLVRRSVDVRLSVEYVDRDDVQQARHASPRTERLQLRPVPRGGRHGLPVRGLLQVEESDAGVQAGGTGPHGLLGPPPPQYRQRKDARLGQGREEGGVPVPPIGDQLPDAQESDAGLRRSAGYRGGSSRGPLGVLRRSVRVRHGPSAVVPDGDEEGRRWLGGRGTTAKEEGRRRSRQHRRGGIPGCPGG